MCGIAGIYHFNSKPQALDGAPVLNAIVHRGPDSQKDSNLGKCHLLHTRLSILDTSENSNQPMHDETGRYHLVFNGEIYNYRSIRSTLQNKGITFNTDGDTEVVLKQLIVEGISGVDTFDGFFSIGFYDSQTEELLIIRDRFGIKPLLYSKMKDHVVFGSEMSAIQALINTKEIDKSSMHQYLQLSYIPGPNSIYKNIQKILPGHYARISNGKFSLERYYYGATNQNINTSFSYEKATTQLKNLVEESVKARLISDVPIGTFLSGGLDSSIVTTIAAKYKNNIDSFSLGFRSNSYFNETEFAEIVAKKAKTNHHVVLLEQDDLLDNLDDFLNTMDEPFADSSALAYFVLSKNTRKHVKVALSGDGADELFAGYNKYRALMKSFHGGVVNSVIKNLAPLTKLTPKSRSTSLGNLGRKMSKYSGGLKLSPYERYWSWSSFTDEQTVAGLLKEQGDSNELTLRKRHFLENKERYSINDVLISDQSLVLTNDMLYKADKMSMANSLEVRVPFLDHKIVEFSLTLPAEFKINNTDTKRILRDAFRSELPSEILERSKKGFEVPLEEWFTGPLLNRFLEMTTKELIVNQGIFNPNEIEILRKKLKNKSIANEVHLFWALFVFQSFWIKKYTL